MLITNDLLLKVRSGYEHDYLFLDYLLHLCTTEHVKFWKGTTEIS